MPLSRGPRAPRPAAAAVLAVVAVSLLVAGCSGDDDRSADSKDAPESTTTSIPGDVDTVLAVDGDEAVAELDERYQSYNVEMVEVTGGYFWAPYEAGGAKVFRAPIDLASPRLRNLAKALGPAYIRVSGTWANNTFFDEKGTTTGAGTPEVQPPEGFDGVLTADQWKGVGAFADAVDGEITTSFASGDAVRDASGAWLPDQARTLLEFSERNDIPLAAAELFNEANLGVGLPKGYTAQDFIRDSATFQQLVDDVDPDLLVVGPGSADDTTPVVFTPPIRTADMLNGLTPPFERFSFHFYPKVSERCGSKEGPEIALSQDYLTRLEADKAYYQDLRDKYAPGAGLWVTETAQAGCGGDRWASTFRDVPRYVDTLGRFGDGDGNVVFHNTLAASDYGLLDEDGFVPRPDYWAAVLWGRLMGDDVLKTQTLDATKTPDLAVYAHCTPDARTPSATYAVVNSSTTSTRRLATGSDDTTVYRLTGDLDSHDAALNGKVLEAHEDGTLPPMDGEKVQKGSGGVVEVPPASVAFVVAPTSAKACD